ncbi:MAG: GNAT family N-acetyltransferase [Hydrogenophaga sp.]|uniref:GNAT family N-acetyltransferase n=1 Tax=Hydrogenophaga sp. TaxID=1904254 RepID=UPI002718A4DD|nr:GNAT family N-acetyltransferase [Hydrogenophaga sp.]MDO9482795.1 GNAT family N-acetyltransferase [Hydrogenophaga sp.]MDP3343988.1 GNAT family N-acetyltransferase [Hydrogenophaga sp.]MDP3807600.1 GNAT family N-acetyltransferase [Hydrogenophaga sp.]MDP3924753.1 GNAT family N-acetyltransferase [Hydrogenophaga sp.]
MEYLPVRCDETAYADYVQLFAKCFPGAEKFSRNYLDWLYRCNPDGQVVGFDARDGDRLAAHYACIPARAHVGGEEVRVLLSLNTATHPDYQGKGLFTQLAERTYTAGTAQGYDCVYGIANANSTPGFIRKLKFQLVGPLQAKVGFGPLSIDFAKLTALQFVRCWSPQALTWRCASPINPLIIRSGRDHTTFLAPALLGGTCMATAEIGDTVTTAGTPMHRTAGLASPLRLFIGRVPASAQRLALYVDIPQRLRPSPLNLIYRSFSGRVETIDLDAVFLHFLDFDAY